MRVEGQWVLLASLEAVVVVKSEVEMGLEVKVKVEPAEKSEVGVLVEVKLEAEKVLILPPHRK